MRAHRETRVGGQGHYGIVYKGTYTPPRATSYVAAIKTLKMPDAAGMVRVNALALRSATVLERMFLSRERHLQLHGATGLNSEHALVSHKLPLQCRLCVDALTHHRCGLLTGSPCVCCHTHTTYAAEAREDQH